MEKFKFPPGNRVDQANYALSMLSQPSFQHIRNMATSFDLLIEPESLSPLHVYSFRVPRTSDLCAPYIKVLGVPPQLIHSIRVYIETQRSDGTIDILHEFDVFHANQSQPRDQYYFSRLKYFPLLLFQYVQIRFVVTMIPNPINLQLRHILLNSEQRSAFMNQKIQDLDRRHFFIQPTQE